MKPIVNPEFQMAAVSAARVINPKIPEDAQLFFFANELDHYEEFDFDSGLMSTDEIENMIEDARHRVLLPPGFMCLGFHEKEDQSTKFYAVVDVSTFPEILFVDKETV